MKRCVNGFLKKIVAAEQKWKCAICDCLLNACFEVDHKLRLASGGSNERINLQALCPNCHAIKTMDEFNDNLETSSTSLKKFPDKECSFCHNLITNRTSLNQIYHVELLPNQIRSCKHERKLQLNRIWQKKGMDERNKKTGKNERNVKTMIGT